MSSLAQTVRLGDLEALPALAGDLLEPGLDRRGARHAGLPLALERDELRAKRIPSSIRASAAGARRLVAVGMAIPWFLLQLIFITA
jgi:hypothetical protein